ncbi:MAG: hypothetical protein ACOX9R_16090 [Armatimonadota bacterium]|jgi:hypothetical protein
MTISLDALRDTVCAWTESLWDRRTGGFRHNAQIGPNVMSTTDVVWMRYAVNASDLAAGHRDAVVACLQGYQDPVTGKVCHDPGPAGQGHSCGHAFWQTVRALNLLGADLLHFPHHLRSALTVEGLERWFDAVDWDGPTSNHHEVLALTPLLASLDDPAWAETYFRKIGEQQDPTTGTWSRSRTNISRTFAYTALHRAAGRMPERPERMLDTILSLQRPGGFWEDEPRFLTMDCIYLLTRTARDLGYRRADADEALARAAAALADFLRTHGERLRENPHSMSANVHAFALLQEAFPEEYPGEAQFRFHWDRPEAYYSEVVARIGGDRSS